MQDPWYQGLLRLQSFVYHETVGFFQRQHFHYLLAPVTTDTISSPMGRGSDSLPVAVQLFGSSVYLADSMQFVLEYATRLDTERPGAYYVATSFRGEDPDATHLNQFFHVECEVRGDMNTAVRVAEKYIQALCSAILNEPTQKTLVADMAGTLSHVTSLHDQLCVKAAASHGCVLPMVSVDEAVKIFEQGKYGVMEELVELVDEESPHFGRKLTRKGEQAIMSHSGGGAVWLTQMDHLSVPFYQAYADPNDRVNSKALCADLLLGVGETLGLGQRHETAEEVKAALAHHGVPGQSYLWYEQMREVMPLRTAGWGMGLERFMCWMLKHDDVRDISILPRLKGHRFLP